MASEDLHHPGGRRLKCTDGDRKLPKWTRADTPAAAAYRAALAAGGEELLSRRRKHGEDAAGAGQPARPGRPEGPGSTGTVAPSPWAGGTRAKGPGTCPLCIQPFPAGAPIVKLGDGWGHRYCATEEKRRQKILSGARFAGHQPSRWRLGSGPGSARNA